MSMNLSIYNFKVLAQKPVINRLKPMQTETGLKTADHGFLWSSPVFLASGKKQTGYGYG